MLGIVLLVAFVFRGGVFGPLNDVAVIVQYTLMLPIAVVLRRLLRERGPGLALAATTIGIFGMLAVVVLQSLLVLGAMPFSRQIVLVVPAFLVVLVWFVLCARLAGGDDPVPSGLPLSILAGLYVGYPVWGYTVGRRLLALAQEDARV